MTRLTYQIKCPTCTGPLRAAVGEDRTVCTCVKCGRLWLLGIHAASKAPVLRAVIARWPFADGAHAGLPLARVPALAKELLTTLETQC